MHAHGPSTVEWPLSQVKTLPATGAYDRTRRGQAQAGAAPSCTARMRSSASGSGANPSSFRAAATVFSGSRPSSNR